MYLEQINDYDYYNYMSTWATVRAGRDSVCYASLLVVERDECQVRCVEVNTDSES